MNNEIANFFWIGSLSVCEKKCIESFIKHNFTVRVWSFTEIHDLPKGSEWCDANKIISAEILHKASYSPHSFPNAPQYRLNAAAVSDIFRVNVGNKIEGWYFDADCFCLKDQEDFKLLRKNKLLVVGSERVNDTYYVNTAVMYNTSKVSLIFHDAIEQECVKNNYVFNRWADIGPNIISELIRKNNLSNDVLDHTFFYSIKWNEMQYFLDPSLLQSSIIRNKNSYVSHLWNTQLNLTYDTKNNLPPKDSYIDYLFRSLDE